MIFRSATLKGCPIHDFKQKGVTLYVVATYKYLGNYIADDLSDDDDINIVIRTLYVQGNVILQNILVVPRVNTHTVLFIFLTPVWVGVCVGECV